MAGGVARDEVSRSAVLRARAIVALLLGESVECEGEGEEALHSQVRYAE